MEKEYFCTSCKKFVKEIRSAFGTQIGPSWLAPAGELPGFVCPKCESPLMEFAKQDKDEKQKKRVL